ncbi:protein numb homolog [Adelges cooleyi]|uniref:protein numb homolog n=1 Tax=Adelges cooleyi TaxID=133065 RepID=UPI00218032DB|nr:protein numb homolog [Adelges cooleyi]
MQTTIVVRKKRTHRDSGQASNNNYFPDHPQDCWPSDEEDIRSGNCSFHVDYLGRVELDASETRNPKACRDSFEKLHEEYTRGELHPPSAVLWITGYELRVVEKESKDLILAQIIENVYFCSSTVERSKQFFYTSKDVHCDRWWCHLFIAKNDCSGDRLCRAVGIAFRECLRRKILRQGRSAVSHMNRCIG